VLRRFVGPGEAVLVVEPCWFGVLGLLAAHDVRIVTAPCRPDGPDLDAVERLMGEARPRLMVLSATAHNPTGFSLSREAATRLVALARAHDVLVFEDDVYSDLGAPGAPRLSAIDGLTRSFYAGSFSKTLASNLRVGFVAAAPDRAAALVEGKILSGFTTPEINVRLVYKLLVEARYPRHVARLRARLAESRARLVARLAGFPIFGAPASGMFLWVDMGCDTHELAVRARDRGVLLAPGGLFAADQRPSPWMRINAATPLDAAFEEVLAMAREGR
jgi:DNA-binding transcriptional MocR family regulator